MDFIDGENLDTLPQMPLPAEMKAIEPAEPVEGGAAAPTGAQASAAAAAASTDSPKATNVVAENPELEEVKGDKVSPGSNKRSSPSVVRNFNVNNLETFQKYKILGSPAQASKLKSIFANYVCVGDNIFSTTAVDDKISFETKNFFFGRKFTILI